MDLILWWYFILFVLGLSVLPISFVFFRHLPDKGYAFSKVLALLLLGYFSWLLGYFSFGTGTILFSFFLLLAVSGAILRSGSGKAFFDFVKKQMGFLLLEEIVFLVIFIIAGAYKMRTHDIVGTEKPMDFAFINGILASPSMPPQDPWLSGGSISYYYFGYLIVAVLAKLSQVTSGEAFNLAIALTWALAGLGAFSLAYALTRRYRYSFLSMVALIAFGNLDFLHRIVQSFQYGDLRIPYYNQPQSAGNVGGIDGALGFLFSPLQHGWDYFQASRIIAVSNTDKMINEFPSFSFFLSDLHPHVMAIPFVLLAIAVSFNVIKSSSLGLRVFGAQLYWQLAQLALLGLIFGGLVFMNSWDFPTFLFLFGLCLSFQQWWAGSSDWMSWFKSMVWICLPVTACALLFYSPFLMRLQSQAQGLGLVEDRTDIYYLFILFGFFLAIIVPVLTGKLISREEKGFKPTKTKKNDGLVCMLCGKDNAGKNFCGYCGGELATSDFTEVAPLPNTKTRSFFSELGESIVGGKGSMRGWIVFGSIVAALLLFNLTPIKTAVVFLMLLLIFFCSISLATRLETKEMVFSTLLIFLALSLVLGCEIFYVKDMFAGGNLYRMNTMFKFHYQVWILFSVASGPFLKWLMENEWVRWAVWKKAAWGILAVLLLVISALYPILSFTSRLNGTSPDMATMDGATYYDRNFSADYQAAQWIKANLKPLDGKVPVILEAWGGSYHQDFGRIATVTGYPTVLGWDFHEVQWRGSGDKAVIRGGDPNDTVVHRQNDIDSIFGSPDLGLTKTLLKKYSIGYVYVGGAERQKYAANAVNLGKFSQLGSVAYQVGSSILYKIND